MSQDATQATNWIEWDGLNRPNEDGPLVRVYYHASGWQPYVPATYWQPAEGGLFEDVFFISAEVDERSQPCTPLTDAEITAARAWFDTHDAWDFAQRVAIEAERARHE